LKKLDKNPIIFIPGFMGSMSDEIIPGTGEWRFGMAYWIYQPFITNLEKMGYRLNQNLFLCFYDWRKKNHSIVVDYLIPIIEKVKEKFAGNKIDLICHSMGGIIARTYIQGDYYECNIDKLIMIGTPNKGALDAYYFWTTGTVMPHKKVEKNLNHIILKGYMWLWQKLFGISFGIDNIAALHEAFPSIGEMIPSLDYGGVLYYKGSLGQWEVVPRRYMVYHNRLLDQLNRDAHLIKHGIGEINCIIGTNFYTPDNQLQSLTNYRPNAFAVNEDNVQFMQVKNSLKNLLV
jgi:hypothetical protein